MWTLLYLAQHYDRLGRTGAPNVQELVYGRERVVVYQEVEAGKGSIGGSGDMSALVWALLYLAAPDKLSFQLRALNLHCLRERHTGSLLMCRGFAL